jgi:hypothetical protein
MNVGIEGIVAQRDKCLCPDQQLTAHNERLRGALEAILNQWEHEFIDFFGEQNRSLFEAAAAVKTAREVLAASPDPARKGGDADLEAL